VAAGVLVDAQQFQGGGRAAERGRAQAGQVAVTERGAGRHQLVEHRHQLQHGDAAVVHEVEQPIRSPLRIPAARSPPARRAARSSNSAQVMVRSPKISAGRPGA
jgi:hypothetical protein